MGFELSSLTPWRHPGLQLQPLGGDLELNFN